jgi:hypothetical protein
MAKVFRFLAAKMVVGLAVGHLMLIGSANPALVSQPRLEKTTGLTLPAIGVLGKLADYDQARATLDKKGGDPEGADERDSSSGQVMLRGGNHAIRFKREQPVASA